MTSCAIIAIHQCDGGTRYLAVDAAAAAAIRRDPTWIDAVSLLGVLDVDRDGRLDRGRAGPLWREVPRDVRLALESAARAAEVRA